MKVRDVVDRNKSDFDFLSNHVYKYGNMMLSHIGKLSSGDYTGTTWGGNMLYLPADADVVPLRMVDAVKLHQLIIKLVILNSQVGYMMEALNDSPVELGEWLPESVNINQAMRDVINALSDMTGGDPNAVKDSTNS